MLEKHNCDVLLLPDAECLQYRKAFHRRNVADYEFKIGCCISAIGCLPCFCWQFPRIDLQTAAHLTWFLMLLAQKRAKEITPHCKLAYRKGSNDLSSLRILIYDIVIIDIACDAF